MFERRVHKLVCRHPTLPATRLAVMDFDPVFLTVSRAAIAGLEHIIHIALVPVLRLLGIGRSAANVTVVGVALGLSYGAGLLIRDLDEGVMTRRDAYLALCFLGLLHSVMEDTLLIMALGADLSGILWARMIFAFAVIAVLARVLSYQEARRTVLDQPPV